MATISATITQGGSPLVGATVTFGDVASLVTDENGTVSATVAEDFSVFVALTVEHGDLLGGRRDYGIHLFKAGGAYTFTV